MLQSVHRGVWRLPSFCRILPSFCRIAAVTLPAQSAALASLAQTASQTDRQTARQTDRQTDRQTASQLDRQSALLTSSSSTARLWGCRNGVVQKNILKNAFYSVFSNRILQTAHSIRCFPVEYSKRSCNAVENQ